jgi:hypothetical protein
MLELRCIASAMKGNGLIMNKIEPNRLTLVQGNVTMTMDRLGRVIGVREDYDPKLGPTISPRATLEALKDIRDRMRWMLRELREMRDE